MENTTTETKKCPYCGGEIDLDAKKCKFCGEWVDENKKNLPKEIRRFNWGAFLLNWIWGVMHKKYITLLILPASIIPFIGPLALAIWFGFKGNEWAWESKEWENVEQFNEVQTNWVRIWLILFILGLIFSIKTFLLLVYIGNTQI